MQPQTLRDMVTSPNGRHYQVYSNTRTTDVFRCGADGVVTDWRVVATEPGGTADDMGRRHALYVALASAGAYD